MKQYGTAQQHQSEADTARAPGNGGSLHDTRKSAIAQRAFNQQINDSPRMSMQRKQLAGLAGAALQRQEFAQPKAPKPNNTGLPDRLKSGIETLSGMSMDHVKVHYNSSRPAQFNALAYAQGSNIHLGPGQQQHLPHEAWHVVQQLQGRVRATAQLAGVGINDDAGLENEATAMGSRANAMQAKASAGDAQPSYRDSRSIPAQLACKKCVGERDDEPAPAGRVVQGVMQRVTECAESSHYSDPIGLWIQEQYVADISGTGEKEYAVKNGGTWNYVDIADEPYGEVYEIKSANIGAAQAATEASYYKDLLNSRCNSGRPNQKWILGKKFATTWRGTFGNYQYDAWSPRNGAIIYDQV